YGTSFNSAGWLTGTAGFGSGYSNGGVVIGTNWTGSDIWLRRTFTIGSQGTVSPYILMQNDGYAVVYIDGVFAASSNTTAAQYSAQYANLPISSAAIALMSPGTHTIAVQCHNSDGYPFIDTGIMQLNSTNGCSGVPAWSGNS